MNSGPLWNTLGPSLLALRGLASDEQQGWWLQRTITMRIVVSYAQTELGHGSNVRGLRTTATFDAATQVPAPIPHLCTQGPPLSM